MSKKRMCWMCSFEGSGLTDAEFDRGIAYVTAIVAPEEPDMHSTGFLIKPTVKSALRFVRRAKRDTGLPFYVSPRSRNIHKKRRWSYKSFTCDVH